MSEYAGGAPAIGAEGRGRASGAGAQGLGRCGREHGEWRELRVATAEYGRWQGGEDRRFLYLTDVGTMPAHMARYEIATGKSETWLTLGPADPSTFLGIVRIKVSRDGGRHAYYALEVRESNLFVAEGRR